MSDVTENAGNADPGTPAVTIVVVPRERFSAARRSLQSIVENTRVPFELVYVDAGSPPRVQRRLESIAREHGFSYVRVSGYWPPNRARNLGLTHVTTPYVAFLENDVLVSPGWLGALIECAEQTDAWLVGPLYLQGHPDLGRIHMAGGMSRIVEEDGKRRIHEEDRLPGVRLADVSEPLERCETELIELHCLLTRRDVLAQIGGFDEALWCVREQDDLCWSVRAAGGTVFMEPLAKVSYLPPPPIWAADLGFYRTRWSHAWIERTLGHFHEKWALDTGFDDPHYRWLWRRAGLWARQFRHPRRLVAGLRAQARPRMQAHARDRTP